MKNQTKCICCEEKINEDCDYYNYTSENEIICEDCYNSDLDNPITIIDNQGCKHYKGEYTFIDEYGEEPMDNSILEYGENINYKRTDGWRGYYKGKCPNGYKCVEDRWFSGFDGHNMNVLMKNFHSIIENDKEALSYFDYFFAILPTSNVFSQNFELYIRENQKDDFLETINNY